MFEAHIDTQTKEERTMKRRKTLPEKNTRFRYLTLEEEERLMKVIRESCPEREAEILTALHSGMRRSEQYHTAQHPDGGLKWEHIDLEAKVIRLPVSKSPRSRQIPINSVLQRALLAIPHNTSPFVFAGTGPGNWFVKALRKAGIKDFSWHDLRYAFAMRLAATGASPFIIASLLGTYSLQTLLRSHALADAVKLARQIKPAGGPRQATVSDAVTRRRKKPASKRKKDDEAA
jgi:integrase